MRLIDADELIVIEYGGIKFVPKEFIDDAPTVDAVPVVRCKDCKLSYDGLKWFYEDEMGEDMRQFKVLLDGHEKRIKEYRDKKRAERLAEREKA